MRTLFAATALAAVLLVPATASGAARLEAPSTAKLNGRVTATATGLKAPNGPGRFTLTLVADDKPARGANCLADLAGPKRARGGRVRFRARIPAKLRCYQGPNSPLGTIDTTAGRYHLVVGIKVDAASWGLGSFVRRKLRVRG